MKKALSYILNRGKVTLAIMVGALVVATFLQFLVFALPTGRMQNNVKKSVESFKTETIYREVIPGESLSRLDNYTDACMLLGVIYNGKDPLRVKAMNNLTFKTKTGDVDDDYYKSLIKIADGQKPEVVHQYFWYWHGYLIFLKPLFMFFDYNNIRILNMFCQLLSLLALVICMFKKGYKDYIVPFLASFMLLYPVTVSMSLQFSPCFYMMMLSSIALLHWKEYFEKSNNFWIVFLLAGMGTSFFDFLTYPVVTIGVPLIIYFIMNRDSSIKRMAGAMVENGAFWGIGYVGFWLGKWLVASIFLGQNCFTTAISKINQHTSMDSSGLIEEFQLKDVYAKNFLWLDTPMIWVLFLAVLAYLIFRIIKARGISLENLKLAVPIMIVAVSPLVWYAFASSHAYIHYWMEYRNCFVLLFGVLAVFVKMRKKTV